MALLRVFASCALLASMRGVSGNWSGPGLDFVVTMDTRWQLSGLAAFLVADR